MTSISTETQFAGRRGSFPVGTADPNKGSIASMESPLMPIVAGVVQPGYTLVTNDSAACGMSWQFNGTNGQGITRYRFPNNTPEPFPNPASASTAYALIVREDQTPFSTGLIDLQMPVLGIRGQIPQHSIQSTSLLSYTFFFDSANSAINVYNDTTKSWQMGWMQFNPSSTFVAAAARNGVATDPLVQFQNTTLFVAGTFTSFTGLGAAAPTSCPGGFIYIYLNVAGGELVPPTSLTTYLIYDITGSAATSNINITALCPINDQGTVNGAIGAVRMAFATGPNNSLAGGVGGASRWGYMVFSSATAVLYYTSDVLTVYGGGGNPLPGLTYAVLGGAINTISVNVANTLIFLGGNYTSINTAGAATTQILTNTFVQQAAVAMLYNVNNNTYSWIGTNAILLASCVQWTGTVEQSNSSPDGFFYLSGSFRSPNNEVANSTTIVSSSPPTPDLTTANYSTANATVFIQQYAGAYGASQTTTNQTVGIPVTGKDLTGLLNTVQILVPTATRLAITAGAGLIMDFQQSSSSQINPLLGILNQNYPIQGTTNVGPFNYVTATANIPNVTSFYWSFLSVYFSGAVAPAGPTNITLTVSNGSGTNYFIQSLNLTFVLGWNTIPLYGGPSSNLSNSNQPLNPFPAGSPTLINWRLDVNSGATLVLATNNSSLSGNPIYNFCGYAINSNASQILTNSSSPNFSFQSITATSALATFANLNSVTPYVTAPTAIVCSYIPINFPANALFYFNFVPPTPVPTPYGNSAAVLGFTLIRGVAAPVINSAFFRGGVPSLVKQIPRLTGGPPNSPTFSEYGLNVNRIFKIGWAYSATPNALGFGVYQGDSQAILGGYTIIANNLAPAIAQLSYGTAGTQLQSTTLNISSTTSGGTNIDAQMARVRVGDAIFINVGFSIQTFLITLPLPAFQSGGSWWLVNVSNINGPVGDLAGTVTVGIDFFGNQNTSPQILDSNLGVYLLDGTNQNQTQVLMSSYVATGKAWKYLVDNVDNALDFLTNVSLASATTQETVGASRINFNSNYSSVLLAPSDRNVGEWMVIATEGNVGFSKV